MYQRILVALENSLTDEALISHVAELAAVHHSRLLLVHVADGWVARNFEQLQLAESEEMRTDRAYLEKTAERLRTTGLTVTTCLALGDPPGEIVKTAEREGCDLIAMTTHGHRFLGDLLYGSTISAVRHKAAIPVLLVRAPRPQA